MARSRVPAQRILVIAVLMPLWASYLVKAYAWRSGAVQGGHLGVAWCPPFGGETPGYGLPATIMTLSTSVAVRDPAHHAGLERVPDYGCSRPPATRRQDG